VPLGTEHSVPNGTAKLDIKHPLPIFCP